MDINKIIAANLNAWMASNPALDTVQKVESASGIGFGTVRRAKNGEGNITAKNMALLAAAFGRHPAELMAAPPAADYRQPTPAPALQVAEPLPKIDFRTPSKREQRLAAIRALLDATDMEGLAILLHEAEKVSRQYPDAKPKPASSQ